MSGNHQHAPNFRPSTQRLIDEEFRKWHQAIVRRAPTHLPPEPLSPTLAPTLRRIDPVVVPSHVPAPPQSLSDVSRSDVVDVDGDTTGFDINFTSIHDNPLAQARALQLSLARPAHDPITADDNIGTTKHRRHVTGLLHPRYWLLWLLAITLGFGGAIAIQRADLNPFRQKVAIATRPSKPVPLKAAAIAPTRPQDAPDQRQVATTPKPPVTKTPIRPRARLAEPPIAPKSATKTTTIPAKRQPKAAASQLPTPKLKTPKDTSLADSALTDAPTKSENPALDADTVVQKSKRVAPRSAKKRKSTDKASASKQRRAPKRATQPRTSRTKTPPSTGFLSIAAHPYATIYVDGKKVGDTPLIRVKLPSGKRRIRAESSVGDKRFTVEIKAGETTRKKVKFE